METGTLRKQGVKLLNSSYHFSENEISILRHLAERTASHAARQDMKEKALLWQRHNDLETDEPLILIDPEHGWDEIIPDHTLECVDPLARDWEKFLKKKFTGQSN